MIKFYNWIQVRFTYLFKLFLFLSSVLVIVWLFPSQARFVYDYQEGRPWLDDDLIAPYNFAILKSPEILKSEREAVLSGFRPYYRKDTEATKAALKMFEENMAVSLQKELGSNNHRRQSTIIETGLALLDSVFTKGIVTLEQVDGSIIDVFDVYLLENNVARVRQYAGFLTLKNAFLWLSDEVEKIVIPEKGLLLNEMERILFTNVLRDSDYTEMALAAELDAISETRGMVQEGERIISRGEVVTPDSFRVLESYKQEYQKRAEQSSAGYLLFLGRFLLVSISLLLLFFFLKFFRREIFPDNRRISLILLSMILMVLATSILVKYDLSLLLLLPVCIIPITMRAFFDSRVALYVHINTIIILGFLVPRSFDFVFLQFIAGIVAIFSMVKLTRRSHLFLTAILVFATYCSVYLGLTLTRGGTLSDLSWITIAHFAGASILTLLAYPFVNILERIFGLHTDFSLLELADTNNKLLRELNMNAPGTFQHSLQVANLAEEAIREIGGNTLLTRTGALYHDIGKMKNPLFFTENQAGDYNPHDDLSREESAKIIINHVIDGIEMARANRIPEYVIDFIRTHHGTTTARYFYLMHQKENPETETDIKDFMYRGPRPFSKEMAVVMMADAVEASSRSLRKPTSAAIEKLVDELVEGQVQEKQFDNANITLKDITIVKQIFIRRLSNMFHSRIAYPSST
jgi:putative nucleotidyltransferase with HDIG domain